MATIASIKYNGIHKEDMRYIGDMSFDKVCPAVGISGVSTAADNQAQTINNTTAADLRYITAEEYKVLRGIFDRFGIDDLEWCSDAVFGLTCSSFKEFFTTQPAIITHLNKTATDGENATTIRRFIRSLANVNEHLSEVTECYEMLRNIACISKAIGKVSIVR